MIVHGSRQQVVAASFRRCRIWLHVDMHYLHENMHLEQSPEMLEFVNWLLSVGVGAGLDQSETFEIPQRMICADFSIHSLVDSVYPGIDHGEKSDEYFLNRSILGCTNNSVMDLNEELLRQFPGEEHVLLSADSVVVEDRTMNNLQPYPVECLNSLVTSSLPLAHLKLKVGCPIMLLQNLDASQGLCNGTQLRVVEICTRVLKCRIMSVDGKCGIYS